MNSLPVWSSDPPDANNRLKSANGKPATKKPEQPSKKLRLSNLPYDAYAWMHNFYLRIKGTGTVTQTNAATKEEITHLKEKPAPESEPKKIESPIGRNVAPKGKAKNNPKNLLKNPSEYRHRHFEGRIPYYDEMPNIIPANAPKKNDDPLLLRKDTLPNEFPPAVIKEPLAAEDSTRIVFDKLESVVYHINIIYDLLDQAKTAEAVREQLTATRKEIEHIVAKAEQRRRTEKADEETRKMGKVREDIILLTRKLDQIEKGPGFTEGNYALLKEKAKFIAAMWEGELTPSAGQASAT